MSLLVHSGAEIACLLPRRLNIFCVIARLDRAIQSSRCAWCGEWARDGMPAVL